MTLTAQYAGPRPMDDGEGCFGSVAPYWCEHCEQPIWKEPEARCLERETRWEPAWYSWQCPHCGHCDCVNEVKPIKRKAMKVVRRHTIQRHRHELAA